jgi:hypothetical protein
MAPQHRLLMSSRPVELRQAALGSRGPAPGRPALRLLAGATASFVDDTRLVAVGPVTGGRPGATVRPSDLVGTGGDGYGASHSPELLGAAAPPSDRASGPAESVDAARPAHQAPSLFTAPHVWVGASEQPWHHFSQLGVRKRRNTAAIGVVGRSSGARGTTSARSTPHFPHGRGALTELGGEPLAVVSALAPSGGCTGQTVVTPHCGADDPGGGGRHQPIHVSRGTLR